MNISGANGADLIKVEYLSSNGDRKVLQSSKDCPEKYAALRTFFSKYECVVCRDVYEKSLQARCCDNALCATCYFSIPNPKKCPFDRKPFTGSIQNDLRCSGRLTDNIMSESSSMLFGDVQSTVSEADKRRCQAQNDAIKQFNPSSTSRTSQPRRQSEDAYTYTGRHGNSSARPSPAFGNVTRSVGSTDSNTLSFGSHTVTFDGSSPNSESTQTANFVGSSRNSQPTRGSNVLNRSLITITNCDHFTVNGTRFQGRNLTIDNGVVVSGSNTNATTSQARQTPVVRTHNFSAVDVRSIDITTASGDIVLEGQDAENQNQVSVISSQEPRIVNNKLILGCDAGSVRLKLPNLFSANNIRLHVDEGNIVTENGYSINSGGSFHTNMGSVNVKVNSRHVNASAETRVGNRCVNIRNQHVDNWRSYLKCSCHVGNVYVYDD